MTTYQKGQSYGGWNTFKILAGGKVRWPMTVKSGDTNTFKPGNLIEIDSNGEIIIATGSTTAIKGFVLEWHDPVGAVATDECLASGKGSLLIDDAVLESAEISSGITFSIGDYVYDDGTGHLTNSNAACAQKMGRVISVPSGAVRFIYPGCFSNI
jgi:hypothetical protein